MRVLLTAMSCALDSGVAGALYTDIQLGRASKVTCSPIFSALKATMCSLLAMISLGGRGGGSEGGWGGRGWGSPVDVNEHCVDVSLLLGGGEHAGVDGCAVLEVSEEKE